MHDLYCICVFASGQKCKFISQEIVSGNILSVLEQNEQTFEIPSVSKQLFKTYTVVNL